MENIEKKIREYEKKGYMVPEPDIIKTSEQIDGIRESGKRNNAILDYVAGKIGPGVSTQQVDDWVMEKTKELGGVAAPLGFEGYPKSVCVSINDEICHGIPTEERILQEGDIVNVDVSTIYNGYFSDASRMFCIGEVSPERRQLVEVTRNAVLEGLKQVKPWNTLGDMGQAVNDYVKSYHYSVVEEVGGHGVGLEFHEEPFVSYVTTKGTEMLLVPGMVFTIEPMVNGGGPEICIDEDNGWTIYTLDGTDSAQWEVTVAVTEDGYEILAD